MRRPVLVALVLLLVPGVVGCTDQALVDRVARLEQNDEDLRDALTDLGAPDPEAEQSRAAVRAELEAAASRLTEVEASIEALRETIDAQGLDLDDRITTNQLQLEEARAELQQLRTDLTTLTDRVSSLEAQLDAHRSDPFGHGQ